MAAERVVPREVVIKSQESEIASLAVAVSPPDKKVTNSPHKKQITILEYMTASDSTSTGAFGPVLEYQINEAVSNEVSKHKSCEKIERCLRKIIL